MTVHSSSARKGFRSSFTILWISVLLGHVPLLAEENTLDAQTVPSQWDISGYIQVVAKDPNQNTPAEIEIDDLSIFISRNFNQWINPFVEAEIFATPLWTSDHSSQLKDGGFIFERLYNDFNLTPDTRIRVGKFLAPVGQWNLIHAAPLVWSIERPISSTYSFSNYISGIEYGLILDPISGSRIDLYFQPGNDLDPKPLSSHPRKYQETWGASWTLIDDLNSRSSIDVQYTKVKQDNTERTTLSWQKIWYLNDWDIDSQLIYTGVKGEEANELISSPKKGNHAWDGGGYLQARYRLNAQWNLYSRVEHFHFADVGKGGNSYLLGSRFRFEQLGNVNFEFRTGNGPDSINGSSISLSYNAMFRW